jgi:hypothetical protein
VARVRLTGVSHPKNKPGEKNNEETIQDRFGPVTDRGH